jgi:peptidoglycan hydrolase-like protein with peptidoglycan-binding domain
MPNMSIPRVTGSRQSAVGNYSVPCPSLNAVEYGQASLQLGMQGDAVRQLQQQLVNAGYPIQVDGKFGPQTLDAVRRFQSANGLSVDGVVGEHTMAAFESSFTPGRRPPVSINPAPSPSPTTPAAPAPTGPAGQYEQIALRQNGPEFVARARQVAANIGVSPEALFAMMQNESGMRANAVNGGSGATGLIQFMPATARALGTSTEALRNMSPTQQLDYVEKYFQPYKGKIHSAADLYMACFYPAALGKPDDWVMGGQNGTAGAVARANPIFDLNHDGQITAGEFRRYYAQRFPNVQ